MKLLYTNVILLLLSVTCTVADASEQTSISKVKARYYIAAFRRGEDFRPPASDMIVNGQVNAAALKLLAHELAEGESSVRENIVELLIDMGLQVAQPKGTEWLGHQKIVAYWQMSA